MSGVFKLRKILKILVIIAYVSLNYLLFYLLDNKYEKSIPQLFWAIFFVIFSICLLIEREKKKVLTFSSLLLFLLIQTLVLCSNEFHFYIYSLFKWSSF